jgi:hypothetical protein
MDIVTILRDLWRLRFLVICIYLVAVLAGTAMIFKISFPPKLESRKYEVGVATARILVDTPSSQVVEVAPKGSESLGVRANLLASLMVDGVVEEAIARRAGVAPNKLIGVTDTATEPAPVSKPPDPRAFVLTTRVVTNTGGDQLPIIEIEAQAPDAPSAARLGAAAVSGLRDYLDSKAALQQIPNADRLQVTGLGAPVASTVVRGPSDMLAVIVVIFVFGFGCVCILGGLALVRGWRSASAREQPGGDVDVLLFEENGASSAEGEPARSAPGPSDNWLAAARPALVVPPRADDGERDEPQAQTA